MAQPPARQKWLGHLTELTKGNNTVVRMGFAILRNA